jgi:hypothetical protein
MDIVVEENSDTMSSKDCDRAELLWERREEDTIEKWRKSCVVESKLHGEKARHVKKKYTALSVPAIILPLMLSGFSSLIQPYPLVNSATLMVVAILTGMNGFFNLGGKTQKHFQYEALYSDLALEIEAELCRPKAFRVACDVYIERIRNSVSKLNTSAPPL